MIHEGTITTTNVCKLYLPPNLCVLQSTAKETKLLHLYDFFNLPKVQNKIHYNRFIIHYKIEVKIER